MPDHGLVRGGFLEEVRREWPRKGAGELWPTLGPAGERAGERAGHGVCSGWQAAGLGWWCELDPAGPAPVVGRLSSKAARAFRGFEAGESQLCGCRRRSPLPHLSGAECVPSLC